MRNFFLIEDSISNRISFWLLACFLCLLPLPFLYSQLVLAAFTLHSLIHLKKDRLRLIFTKPVLIVSCVYILGMIGFLYSHDLPEAFNVAGRQSAILWLPAVMAVNALDWAKYKIRLLTIFGIGCTLVLLYLYAHALYSIHFFKFWMTLRHAFQVE